jgi:phosphate/sulfate permease
MENLQKIVGYVFCAPLVGAASYALGCLIYYTNKNSKERKKEENKNTKKPYFPNR